MTSKINIFTRTFANSDTQRTDTERADWDFLNHLDNSETDFYKN